MNVQIQPRRILLMVALIRSTSQTSWRRLKLGVPGNRPSDEIKEQDSGPHPKARVELEANLTEFLATSSWARIVPSRRPMTYNRRRIIEGAMLLLLWPTQERNLITQTRTVDQLQVNWRERLVIRERQPLERLLVHSSTTERHQWRHLPGAA